MSDEGPGLPSVSNQPLPELESLPFEALGPNRIAFERISLDGLPGLYVVDGATATVTDHLGGTNFDGATLAPGADEVALRMLTPYDPSVTNQPDWDLYSVGLDGRGLRRLTDQPHNVEQIVTWRPAGDRIAFGVAHRPCCLDRFEVWEQPTESQPGGHTTLLRLISAGESVWADLDFDIAVDGRIAVANPGGATSRGIHLMEAGASAPELVYVPPADEGVRVWAPAWSPDGARLAFLEIHVGPTAPWVTRVKVLEASDLSVTELGAVVLADSGFGGLGGLNDHSACWTGDGIRVVFSVPDGDAAGHIYIVGAEGGEPVPFTSRPGVADRSVSCPL